MIYPDNKHKSKWDLWIVIILLFVAIYVPLRIAYVEDKETDAWQVVNQIVNVTFLADMILTFFTAR